MKPILIIATTAILSGCAATSSEKDKALIEQYPNCVDRTIIFKNEKIDPNCVIHSKLKAQVQLRKEEEYQRSIERDLERSKQNAERKKWKIAQKKKEALENEKIAKFDSSPGLTYDNFIRKVFETPDNTGWVSDLKVRYGKNAPFVPVVKQQIGPNKYIVQSMLARDNPYMKDIGYKNRLLLINSADTLIVGMPVDKPHTLRYDGITTTNTVMGAPMQVIVVTLLK